MGISAHFLFAADTANVDMTSEVQCIASKTLGWLPSWSIGQYNRRMCLFHILSLVSLERTTSLRL